MKKQVIAIMGKAGSGKDSLTQAVLSHLSENIAHKIINTTTRPMRQGEQEGREYYYIPEEKFMEKLRNDEFIQYADFNHWYYGTDINELYSPVNIGVFSPRAVAQLLDCEDIQVSIFYITASDKARLMRQLTREENPDVNEIVRRFYTDNTDFKDVLNFPHLTIMKNETLEDFQSAISKICYTISNLAKN